MAGRLVAATGRTLAAELPEPPEGPTIRAAFPRPSRSPRVTSPPSASPVRESGRFGLSPRPLPRTRLC